jgi:hypothetical protein
LLPEGNSRFLALYFLSLVYGIAKFAITGRLPFYGAADVLAFTEQAIRTIRSGLALGVPQLPSPAKKKRGKS